MPIHQQTRRAQPILRIGGTVLGFAAGLYYLQFGLQALFHYIPQGVLALLGAFALMWGAVRTMRRVPASLLVLVGTLPMLLLHGAMTVADPGELPFLIGSIPVPLVAGIAWLVGRQRSGNSVHEPAEL